MSKSIFIPLVAMLLWIPTMSFSQTEQTRHRMWEELGLTADQKTKLAAMHSDAQKERKLYKDEVSTVRTKIRDELIKSNPSKSVLSGYTTELGNLHIKETQSRIDHLLKLKEILTPEQFQKVLDKQWKGDDEMRDGPHGEKGSNNAANQPACHLKKQDGSAEN